MSTTKKKNAKVGIWILVIVLLLGAAGYGVWRILQLRSELNQKETTLQQTNEELETLKKDIVTDPNSAVLRLQQEQNAAILEEVGEVYTIPEGETPTVATVQDITKLTDQPFFDGAQNGDILIVFDESGQAILYRPSDKKLVKVGPINIEDTPATATEE